MSRGDKEMGEQMPEEPGEPPEGSMPKLLRTKTPKAPKQKRVVLGTGAAPSHPMPKMLRMVKP